MDTRLGRFLWAFLAVGVLGITFLVETAFASVPELTLGPYGWDVIRAISLVYLLVHYRIHKKHKSGSIEGIRDFIDRNIVELTIVGLLFPALTKLVLNQAHLIQLTQG